MQPRLLQEFLREQHGCRILPSTSLRDVALHFIAGDCDVVAVTSYDGALLGVVTESAVVRTLLANPSSSMTIERLMNAHVESVRLSATLNSVLPLFRSSCHTAIPVVDEDNRFCGMLFRRDVMSTMLDHCLQDPNSRATDTKRPEPASSPDVAAGSAAEPMIRDQTAPRPVAGGTRVDQPETRTPVERPNASDSRQSKPHFLTGDEARRRLGSITDFRGGFNENPW